MPPLDGSKSQNGSSADLATSTVRICARCNQTVPGQSECSIPVADKFFPLYAPEDEQKLNPTLYCEKHYFALHGLLCDKCGFALRGPHINALGKKFHLDHFGCHVCPKVFRQHDSYYEREGKVYCQFHYSVLFATKCGGCQTAVLKKFVEMKKEGVLYQWHPQCYMIYKLWHVKANFQHGNTAIDEANPEAEISRQAVTLAKVDKIISVVSTFEDSSANVIGDMMSHHSSRRFAEVCLDGYRFIQYVDALFQGLETIDVELINAANGGEETGILATRQDPRKLTKLIVRFFSLLSQSGSIDGTAIADEKDRIKSEMMQSVAGLATILKSLIRLALNGALKMERTYGSETCIMDFLSGLSNLEKASGDAASVVDTFALLTTTSNKNRTDVCTKCQKSVEEACYKTSDDLFCWHAERALDCFTCAVCSKYLGDQSASVDLATGLLYCSAHIPAGVSARGGITRVSQLQQFSFLLRCSLGRLYSILHGRYAKFDVIESSSEDITRSSPDLQSKQQQQGSSNNLLRPPITPPDEISPSDDDQHAPLVMQEFQKLPRQNPSIKNMASNETDPSRILSEQGALDRIHIRKEAVVALEKILGRRLPELGIESESRTSVWSRFMGNKKGVLGSNGGELLASHWPRLFWNMVWRQQLLQGSYSVRVPKFVEVCLQKLNGMDLTTEGIFRKNGNIRRLKETAEQFDQNPNLDKLDEDNVLQVAALLKKFFRDMPDPLLTFKLYFLFVASQEFEDLNKRKRILHLALCLLPKPNLDLLQVLLQFLRQVSEKKDGNKMDIPNLATVMCPNILYEKPKNANVAPGGDMPQLAHLSIRAVQMLIVYQDEFSMIPDEISITSDQ
ncbi:hypothetical protein BDR26DRAFT_930532 [Obelidium mucronatum]|nr:hypothetical protein BDR26DRAFT_930532 [Obelidium mucronatum]